MTGDRDDLQQNMDIENQTIEYSTVAHIETY